jgi:hypothetical protein
MVYEYYNFAILAVRFYKVIGEIALCNSLIDAMITSFPEGKCISTTNKSYLLTAMNTVRNSGIEGLMRFDKLHVMIMKMNSYE